MKLKMLVLAAITSAPPLDLVQFAIDGREGKG